MRQFKHTYVKIVSMIAVIVPVLLMHPSARCDELLVCDTMYVGPPGGSRFLVSNWTNGIPQPGWVACERPRSDGSEGSLANANDETFTPYDPPPPPMMIGACCMASSCSITDYFDCREQG